MENQENNNLSELDQLKAQYETLKEQFDQQEIVNDRLMKSSIDQSLGFYKRNRWGQVVLYPLAALLGVLIIKWNMGNNLSAKVFWVAFCATCLVIELLLTRKLQLKTLENDDLLTLANRARGFKKLFATFTILNYSTGLILTLGLLLTWIGKGAPNLGAVTVVFGIAIVIFVVLGTAEIRYKTKPCDEIICQIEATETSHDKKPRLDQNLQWFCIAMIVVFIGLDLWAYTIVATHLKLPPMYRTVTYVRPETKIPAEEQLSIWEVFADTIVAPTEVSVVTKKWQQDESLVVMKGFDDDETKVQLYALKMNSPEGPIVCSERIGGKPVVEIVMAQKPVLNEETIRVFLRMTPEASQLWHDYFQTGEKTKSLDIALVVDGMVYWKTNFTSLQGVTNNLFPIEWRWGKDKLDDFCKRLVQQ